MADSYSVQAVLSVKDKNFTSTLKSASNTLSGLDSSTSKSSKSVGALGTAFAVANTVISSACNVIKNSVQDAVARVDTLNQYPKIMEQMGFTSEEAEASIEKLSEGIQGLPTSLDTIVDSAQNIALISGNLDEATDVALALNDALLASGASTDEAARATEAYDKMLSTGKVTSQQWTTLEQDMKYALVQVAKQLGITSGSTQELYSAMQDGSISFDQFNAALIECDTELGGFSEMALTACDGIATSWENVKTAVVRGVANMIQAWNDAAADNGIPTIQESLQGLRNVCDTVFNAASKVITVFVNNLDTIVAAAAPVVTAIAGFKIAQTAAGWFDKVKDSGKKAADSLKNYGEKAKDAEKASENLKIAEEALQGAMDKEETAYQKAIEAAGKLTEAEKKVEEATKTRNDAMEKANSGLEDAGEASAALEAAEAALSKAEQELTQAKQESSAAEEAYSAAKEVTAAATELDAAAQEKDAAAVEGTTLAEIAQNAILAVLSGEMTVAAAAQEALNVAMESNPVGLFIAAISALVSVLGSVITLIKKFTGETESLRKSAKKTKEEVEDLSDAWEEERDAVQDNIDATKKSSSVNEDLCSKITSLVRQESLSASETATLNSYIDLLNGNVEGLDLSYDSLTDSLNMSAEAMEKQVQAADELAEYQSIQDEYNASLERQGEIQDQIAEKTEELANLEAIQAEAAQTGAIIGVGAKKDIQTAIEELEAQEQEEAALQDDLLDQMGTAQKEYTSLTQEAYALQAQALEEAVASQTLSLDMLTEENQATVEELQATWQDYTDAATNMFDTLDDTIDLTVEDMIDNITKNQEIMSQWGDNCESLRDRFAGLGLDTAILDQLVDMGPEGAAYIAALTEASDTELAILEHDYERGGSVAWESMNSAMGEGASEVMKQAENLITQVDQTLVSKVAETDWADTGESIPKGVAEGVESGSEGLFTAVDEMGNTSITRFGESIGYGSPAAEFMPAGESIPEGVAEGIKSSDAAVEAAEQMAEQVIEAATNSLSEADFSGPVDSMCSSIASATTAGMSQVSTAVSKGMNDATTALTNGFKTMATDTTSNMNAIKANVTAGMNAVRTMVQTTMSAVQTNVQTVLNNIKSNVQTELNNIKSAVTTALNSIKSTVTSTMSSIKSTVTADMNSIKSTISSAMNSCSSSVSSAMSAIRSSFSSGMNSCVSTARSACSSITSAFSGLYSSLYGSGTSAMAGLQAGLNAGSGSVMSTARSIANSVTSTINSALKVGSPSKVLTDTGEDAGQGLVNGLKNMISKVKDVSLKMADTVTDLAFGSLDTPNLAFEGGMTMSYYFDDAVVDALDDLTDAIYEDSQKPIQVTVYSELDGREIAKGTAQYMQDEQDKLQARKNRRQQFSISQ